MSVSQRELPEHTRFGINPEFERFNAPIEFVFYKPAPFCSCGCGKRVEVIELRTHEGDPIESEACFMRIAYQEGWIVKEAV